MIMVIVLFSIAILGAVLEIMWLNADWIAPAGWGAWIRRKFRSRDDE